MKRVAIQGIEGSYGEDAARKLLDGERIEIVECTDFDAAFAAMHLRDAEMIVVPVRNKIVGEIEIPARLLRESGLRVVDEMSLRVSHVLAGTPDAVFENVVSVRSHPEALKQCAAFFLEHKSLRPETGNDTASSIRRIAGENKPARAAIGSRRAAEMYGAKVLRENIADDRENWTDFVLIGE